MASTIQHANLTSPLAFLPSPVPAADYLEIFEQNRRRAYALAFWMTDHELMAEDLMERAFSRAFLSHSNPSCEDIDQALIAELRLMYPLGELTLREPIVHEAMSIRGNTLRVHLERAVVQLPPTEKLIFLMHDVEGYDHARIVRTLGITREDSQSGLHQARLRVRNLVAAMPR